LQSLQMGLGTVDAITKADVEANALRKGIIGIVQRALMVFTGVAFCPRFTGQTKRTRSCRRAAYAGMGSRLVFRSLGELFGTVSSDERIWKVSVIRPTGRNTPRGAILPWCRLRFIASGITATSAFKF
jgi:hypothetical protein